MPWGATNWWFLESVTEFCSLGKEVKKTRKNRDQLRCVWLLPSASPCWWGNTTWLIGMLTREFYDEPVFIVYCLSWIAILPPSHWPWRAVGNFNLLTTKKSISSGLNWEKFLYKLFQAEEKRSPPFGWLNKAKPWMTVLLPCHLLTGSLGVVTQRDKGIELRDGKSDWILKDSL